MPEDAFTLALNKARQIKITMIGRNTGRTITLPVWFVHTDDTLWLLPVHGSNTQWYQNLIKNPTITIKVGREERTLKAKMFKNATAVNEVIESFRKKYTPEIITKLYPGPLNAAVRVKL
jgi:deazaflavin-dependent oxidoreductase (nitroreductase family)